jgi:cytochrome c oxidase cbb3-type subunit IV
MSLGHDFLVGISKSVGLFYLMAMFAAALVYAYWPSNKPGFERAARSILEDEDEPWQ